MIPILKVQQDSERLRAILKHSLYRRQIESCDEIVSILVEVPAGFSVSHIAHEILQFLKAYSGYCGPVSTNGFDTLVDLLVSKFECSFRPNSRDVIELCKLYTGSFLGPMFKLLYKCLVNQQGNPKQTFLLIVDEFLSFVDGLDASVLGSYNSAIELIIGTMFQSEVNVSLMSAYLVASGETNAYVSRLFASSHSVTVWEFVLKAFGQFSLFSRLLQCGGLNYTERIELWIYIGKLRLYQIRGNPQHHAELECFVNDVCTWRGVYAVLQVDPISFTDKMVNLCKSLRDSEDQVTTIQYMCQLFSSKGSLSEFVLECINIEGFCFDCESLEISPIDYCALVTGLAQNLHTSNTCVETLIRLIPLCVYLPNNLRVEISSLFASILPKIDSKKDGKLTIGIIDGLRIVQVAWTIPMCDTVDDTVEEIVYESLCHVAAKSKDYRAAALVRLCTLCDVEISVDEIFACKFANERLDEFFAQHHLNRRALVFRLAKDVKVHMLMEPQAQLVVDDSLMDVVVEESDIDVNVLLEKSQEIFARFGRLVFVPLSLRRADFPLEILALESAWSAGVCCVDELVRIFTDSGSELALYGLACILEHTKRENIKHDTHAELEVKGGASSARYMLALHSQTGKLAENLLLLANEIICKERDSVGIDCAYFCLLTGITSGIDRRKIALPWWTQKIHMIIPPIRGLVGACVDMSGESTNDSDMCSQHVVRLWKTLSESFSREKRFRFTKSAVLFAGEYIRLSHKITNESAATILDKGCATHLLSKLNQDEKNWMHAMLGKSDRETLKRINALLEANYTYSGKA